jgi:hypothetical protein
VGKGEGENREGEEEGRENDEAKLRGIGSGAGRQV